MPGLYIHIPFCRQKCHYCNFFSIASKKYINEIVQAIQTEVRSNSGFFNGSPLNTIYFGGGTPSLLSINQINEIIDTAIATFGIDPNAEITVEANPDDLINSWLQALSQTVVNRLSIGVQSFRNEDLTYLNRVHSANQAESAIQNALKYGFKNISIDLIYAIPTLDNEQWIENINRALSYNIPHISAYALTVEPGTALDLFIKKGKYKQVEEEKVAEQFQIIMKIMAKSGYEHYEISNFALPDRYSRHNKSYWSGESYLGGFLIALDTREVNFGFINWTAELLEQNQKKYAIRLFYRFDVTEPFRELIIKNKVLEYNPEMHGSLMNFLDIPLPDYILNKQYVQLLWKFYYFSGNYGKSHRIRLDDINIADITYVPKLNFANIHLYPYNNNIYISFPERTYAAIDIYDVAGRLIKTRQLAGANKYSIDMYPFKGIFIARIYLNNDVYVKKFFVN